MTPEDAAKLRQPFPPETIGKLPKGGITLDYVGHAAVTDRLLQVDPGWTWEPLALTPEGLPALDRVGNLWIRLTCAGVTRVGVGDGKNAKECISDAIRNAAMRFGVALDLWAKEDLSVLRPDSAGEPTANGDTPAETPVPSAGTTSLVAPAPVAAAEQASPVEPPPFIDESWPGDDGKFPPVDQPEPGPLKEREPDTAKALNALVGQLRTAGHITTEQLWRRMRPGQEWPRDMDGELHWAPLRDSLSKDEASTLRRRLSRLAHDVNNTDFAARAAEAIANREVLEDVEVVDAQGNEIEL